MTDAKTPGDMLREFHERPGVDIEAPPQPTLDVPGLDARVSYIREEFSELQAAQAAGDVVAYADALADIAYLLWGTAWRTGIDLDAVVAEVHRSNMTKTPAPGDGKALKGQGYTRPDVLGVLTRQAGTDPPSARVVESGCPDCGHDGPHPDTQKAPRSRV